MDKEYWMQRAGEVNIPPYRVYTSLTILLFLLFLLLLPLNLLVFLLPLPRSDECTTAREQRLLVTESPRPLHTAGEASADQHEQQTQY